MSEFFRIAAPLMALASMVLLFSGIITHLRRSKAFYFIVGEFAFVTAINYACLAALGSTWFARIGLLAWFVTGSAMFGVAAFRARE